METIQKLCLKTGDRVKIVKVGPTNTTAMPYLEGAEGEVVGLSHMGLIDTYIVLLDKPHVTPEFTHKAVGIPEVCLERLPRQENYSSLRPARKHSH